MAQKNDWIRFISIQNLINFISCEKEQKGFLDFLERKEKLLLQSLE